MAEMEKKSLEDILDDEETTTSASAIIDSDLADEILGDSGAIVVEPQEPEEPEIDTIQEQNAELSEELPEEDFGDEILSPNEEVSGKTVETTKSEKSAPISITKEQEEMNKKRLEAARLKAQEQLRAELSKRYNRINELKFQLKKDPFLIRLLRTVLAVLKAPFRALLYITGRGETIRYTEKELLRKRIQDEINENRKEINELKNKTFDIKERTDMLGNASYEYTEAKKEGIVPEKETENKTEKTENISEKPVINPRDKFKELLKTANPMIGDVQVTGPMNNMSIDILLKNNTRLLLAYNAFKGEATVKNSMGPITKEDIQNYITEIYSTYSLASQFAEKPNNISEKYARVIYEKDILPLITGQKSEVHFNIEAIDVQLKKVANGVECICNADGKNGFIPQKSLFNIPDDLTAEKLPEFINKAIKEPYCLFSYKSALNQSFPLILSQTEQFKRIAEIQDISNIKTTANKCEFTANVMDEGFSVPATFTLHTQTLDVEIDMAKEDYDKLPPKTQVSLKNSKNVIKDAYTNYMLKSLPVEKVIPDKELIGAVINRVVDVAEEGKAINCKYYDLNMVIEKNSDFTKVSVGYGIADKMGRQERLTYNCYDGKVSNEDIDEIYNATINTIKDYSARFEQTEINFKRAKEINPNSDIEGSVLQEIQEQEIEDNLVNEDINILDGIGEDQRWDDIHDAARMPEDLGDTCDQEEHHNDEFEEMDR